MTEYKYTDSFSPDSVLVQAAYYHRGEQTLFVKMGVSIYGYSKVPLSVWDAFAASASAGNYFNTNIKGKYESLGTDITLRYIGEKEASFHDAPHTFVITGHSVVEWEFQGHTLEDAKTEFYRLFPKGVLQEVKVKFE